MFRGLRAVRAITVGVACGAFAAATPAYAEPPGVPSDCAAWANSNGVAYSYCSTGPGFHRVKITCRRASNPNFVDIIYGDWRQSGTSSAAHCYDFRDAILTANYQLHGA